MCNVYYVFEYYDHIAFATDSDNLQSSFERTNVCTCTVYAQNIATWRCRNIHNSHTHNFASTLSYNQRYAWYVARPAHYILRHRTPVTEPNMCMLIGMCIRIHVRMTEHLHNRTSSSLNVCIWFTYINLVYMEPVYVVSLLVFAQQQWCINRALPDEDILKRKCENGLNDEWPTWLCLSKWW